MIVQFSDTLPKRVATFPDWTLVHLQCATEQPVRIAMTAAELEQPGAGNISQGLTVAASSGILSLWWKGELHAAAVSGAAFDYQPISGGGIRL